MPRKKLGIVKQEEVGSYFSYFVVNVFTKDERIILGFYERRQYVSKNNQSSNM